MCSNIHVHRMHSRICRKRERVVETREERNMLAISGLGIRDIPTRRRPKQTIGQHAIGQHAKCSREKTCINHGVDV